MSSPLLSAASAQTLDEEASARWGLDPYALVEAAGRACAEAFAAFLSRETQRNVWPYFSFVVLAGKGNNAADALVMLRALVLNGFVKAANCRVFAAQVPTDSPDGEKTPLSQALLAARMLGVPVQAWDSGAAAAAADAFADAHVIIDGITGTGLTSPLRGGALEMVEALNALDRGKNGPLVVSIDIPSGNFDGWQPGIPIVAADATLAIEPQKLCLYVPTARPHAGTIVPVSGIFPSILTDKYKEAELIDWEGASARIPPIAQTAHKYERGLVEIRAGSAGAVGAARLAALGAQAAGAGLVRLMADTSLYSVLASGCTGIMVDPQIQVPGETAESGRFAPNAALLGPGWGRGEDRMRLLESYLPLEERGLPLILDADAIALAKDFVFHGNAVLTPHPGEFVAYTGLPKDEILNDPIPALRRCAAEKNAHILLKGHVLYAVSPDGRIGIIDGMNPALAAGGSGDVLAGLCAALAARHKPFDGYACMCAAASLLLQAAESIAGTFFDPAELAHAASAVAGKAWLPKKRRVRFSNMGGDPGE
ncbi:MAG: NAD(P)H-hydrate dehydratase [Treponema sp.]|jgi:NAD(P)H-hydrate epimerase|nr:NAD(P)H-hydrate dehydratase [Treponema sp.]